jgi:hypothetical protein
MAPTATTPARTTRSKTGNSKPRIFPEIETTTTTTKKRGGTKKKSTTKANTSKPRVKKTTTGRVTKPKATKKTATKKDKSVKAKVEGKVNGAVEKVEGALEGKGKKVGQSHSNRSASASAGPSQTMKLPHRPLVPAKRHASRAFSTSRVAPVTPAATRRRAPKRVTRSGVAGARTPSMERAEELSIGPVRAAKTVAIKELSKRLIKDYLN